LVAKSLSRIRFFLLSEAITNCYSDDILSNSGPRSYFTSSGTRSIWRETLMSMPVQPTVSSAHHSKWDHSVLVIT
jgi:hypothetical protein